jgi:hypothetical protein
MPNLSASQGEPPLSVSQRTPMRSPGAQRARFFRRTISASATAGIVTNAHVTNFFGGNAGINMNAAAQDGRGDHRFDHKREYLTRRLRESSLLTTPCQTLRVVSAGYLASTRIVDSALRHSSADATAQFEQVLTISTQLNRNFTQTISNELRQ